MSSTEPFDLVSHPDAHSNLLRERLLQLSLASALALPGERCVVKARDLHDVTTQALDLTHELLMLRRCLIVLMRASGVEALALPFAETVLAATVPLRVKHDPAALPDLLQLLIDGEGLVTIASSAYASPPERFDSEGHTEAVRLRAALVEARKAIVDAGGRDTVLALIDVSLR